MKGVIFGDFKRKQRHQVILLCSDYSHTVPLLSLPVNYSGLFVEVDEC